MRWMARVADWSSDGTPLDCSTCTFAGWPSRMYVEGDVDALRVEMLRVHFVLQPVFGNLLLHHAHVPGIARSEIAATAGEAESALGSARAERAIRAADRAALPEGNHVVWLRLPVRLRLSDGSRWSSACGFFFVVLSGNRESRPALSLPAWAATASVPWNHWPEHFAFSPELAGSGTVLTRVTPMASPPPPAPQPSATGCSERPRRRAQWQPATATCSPERPGQVAAPAVVFKENFSVGCHARPAVE